MNRHTQKFMLDGEEHTKLKTKTELTKKEILGQNDSHKNYKVYQLNARSTQHATHNTMEIWLGRVGAIISLKCTTYK